MRVKIDPIFACHFFPSCVWTNQGLGCFQRLDSAAITQRNMINMIMMGMWLRHSLFCLRWLTSCWMRCAFWFLSMMSRSGHFRWFYAFFVCISVIFLGAWYSKLLICWWIDFWYLFWLDRLCFLFKCFLLEASLSIPARRLFVLLGFLASIITLVVSLSLSIKMAVAIIWNNGNKKGPRL